MTPPAALLGRAAAPQRISRCVGWALVAFVLAGCATAAPEHAPRIAEAQRLADGARTAFGGPAVTIYVSDDVPRGAGAQYRGGMLVFTPAMTRSPNFIALVVHELGHVTLGHTQRETRREDAWAQELDANARGVEILRVVDGLSGREAARRMAVFLAAASRSLASGGTLPDGHPHPCIQLRDLNQRYPGDWAKTLVCVETAR